MILVPPCPAASQAAGFFLPNGADHTILSKNPESENGMLYFESDYMQGAHPAVLEALVKTNMEPMSGYGADRFTASAAEKLREACACPGAEIFFTVGGTQTNRTVIDTMLAPYEGVAAAVTGHIATHEAGAIEAGGHKVLPLPHHYGKLDAGELRTMLETFHADANREHMVFPGMVYISHPTEYGTLYSRAELTAVAGVCRDYGIPLYLDGARLGYGLMCPGADVTLPDIAALCDVFYIGGTKVGALCGEALVFTKGNMPPHFQGQAKQHGALLAKGRLVSVQFDALFTDGLYFHIGAHAAEMAARLRSVLREKGCRFFLDSPTNQQFVILENDRLAALAEKVVFSRFEPYDRDRTVVRFAVSWATTPEDIDGLAALL